MAFFGRPFFILNLLCLNQILFTKSGFLVVIQINGDKLKICHKGTNIHKNGMRASPVIHHQGFKGNFIF